jgi:pimeloyl-ACP methyl ester carboxylesterase
MKRFISSDGSSINYRVVGKGRPILFLHGWSVDQKLWSNRVESIRGAWKRDFKRVYLDLPGMGRSIASAQVRNSDDVLRIIKEFLAAIIGDEPYLLAGESYGGYLARGLLLDQAERIDGLFLLCPLIVPGKGERSVVPKVVLEEEADFLRGLSEEERNGFSFLAVVQTKAAWRLYSRDIDLSVASGNEGFLEGRLDGSFSHDIGKTAIDYDRPTLVMAGRQDSAVGYEDQYESCKGFSRASVMVLDKAGHNLQIERRSLFEASFLDWLERVRTFVAEKPRNP